MITHSSPLVAEARAQTAPLLSIASLCGAASLADFLFWKIAPGASVGFFVVSLAALMLAQTQSKWTWKMVLALLLLLLTALQSVVDLSLTNAVVSTALLVVLAGERFYSAIRSSWARWSEAACSVICGPLQLVNLLLTVGQNRTLRNGASVFTPDLLARTVRIVVPAALLTIIFAVILSYGNAILHHGFATVHAFAERWLFSIDLSPARITFWICLVMVLAGFFWPISRAATAGWWNKEPQRWMRRHCSEARWQSVAVLLLVNALFFAVNTIDVVYLWSGAALPAGVSFSEFVHEGVYSLISAVILAAIVLVAVFHQNSEVAQWRPLKLLALLWIGQNLLLIVGVLLRLKLYVHAYQLTELRVYVAVFLVLVTAGFALLARHVIFGLQFGRLLFQNGCATFAIFFLMQFPDVAGTVARYNVNRWQSESRPALDLNYLRRMGVPAWPALLIAANSSTRSPVALEARAILREALAEQKARQPIDWRSWQKRHHDSAQLLFINAPYLHVQQ